MRAIEVVLGQLKRRILSLIARSVVTLVNDALAGQQLQIRLLAGETRDGVERIQNYGFSSVPMEGAYPAVVICAAGDRAQALAIVVDDVRHRPREGMPGDVVVYDWQGNSIRLRPGDPPEEEEDPPPNALLEIVASKDLTINVAGNATLTVTGQLNLGGGGGAKVARVGDSVEVSGVPGTITGGSNKVRAVS